MAKQRNKFNVDEELDSPFNISHLKRSFAYINRYKGWLILALFLSICATVIGLLAPMLTQYVVDNIIDNELLSSNEKLTKSIIYCIGYAILVVIMLLFNRSRGIITNRVGQNIISEIRHDLFEHLQQLPFEYYDSRPQGKILVRVVNYVNSVADFLSNGIINIILETFSLLAILTFMLIQSAKLTLIVLAGLPFFMVYVFAIRKAQRRGWQKLSNRQSNLNAYLAESIDGMKVTQSFARERMNYDIYNTLSDAHSKQWMRCVGILHSMFPVSHLFGTFSTVMLYFLGAFVFQDVTVGVLLGMAGYCWRFWQPINTLGRLWNNLQNAVAYLERIFQVIDEPIAIDDLPDAEPLPAIKGQVEFKNVVFEYEENTPILKNMSFIAKPGESIAFVGPTGSGKTTTVNLISRFYDLKSGEVLIDGHDIYHATIASLRSQMGIMLQETFIFSGTIMDNIKYGRLDATDEEAMTAAKAVSADRFIEQFPKGYYTEVDERGASLSAGQRQLISFARTLLADPKILILDEATSAIDTKTEILVQKGLAALLAGRTSFIIAHRLSTIKSCDRIMYLENGEIIESGNHDELIEKKGAYYRLYTSQLSNE